MTNDNEGKMKRPIKYYINLIDLWMLHSCKKHDKYQNYIINHRFYKQYHQVTRDT